MSTVEAVCVTLLVIIGLGALLVIFLSEFIFPRKPSPPRETTPPPRWGDPPPYWSQPWTSTRREIVVNGTRGVESDYTEEDWAAFERGDFSKVFADMRRMDPWGTSASSKFSPISSPSSGSRPSSSTSSTPTAGATTDD